MNQDSSFPPMLPPSTELGALLFAVLPCLQEPYRPLASFAYHMTELTKLKKLSSLPPLSGLSGIDALVADKETLLRSLSFYGKQFHMPLLSTIASLLQAMQFYNAYKDILPGLFSAMGGGTGASSFDSMAGLFSGLGNSSVDLFSGLGGLSPDLLSSLFSGFSGVSDTPASPASSAEPNTASSSEPTPPDNSPEEPTPASAPTPSEPSEAVSPSGAGDDLYDSLSSFLTPEQKEIYEMLMNTD